MNDGLVMKITFPLISLKNKCDSHGALVSAFFLLVIVGVYFKEFLFFTENKVVSNSTSDIFYQFVHWRKFGFEELKRGNVALWNPYIYSGTPFLGGFQSALFYPLNWIHLFLPLSIALNLEVALHVFIAGYSFFLWSRFRKLGIFASILFSLLFMFSGPFFLNVYAGHLSNLATLAWTPLLFLAAEGWILRKQKHF